jgi:hypothetical protein
MDRNSFLMIRLFQRAVFLVLAFAVVIGCGSSGPTSSYDASDNETVYKSDRIIVGEISESSLGSGASITLQAVSECSGLNCKPETVDLLFSVRSSGSEVGFPNRGLSVTVDGEEYTFGTGFNPSSASDVQVSRTQNMSVKAPFSNLKKIAGAGSIDGRLGGGCRLIWRAPSRT